MGEHNGDGSRRTGQAAAFAHELRELRTGAGNPSFRAMAQSSGRISHTTLHEAATGARFPSWETTKEFVTACGADPALWRARWEGARGEPPSEESVADPQPAPAPVPKGRRIWRLGRRATSLVAGIAVLVLGIAAGVIVSAESGRASVSNTSANAVDASRFIADTTIPDNTVVTVNQRFQKVWQIQNVGAVTWRDRYLQRMDAPPGPGACRTPPRVPIGETGPGQMVWVSVNVVAPTVPGVCWVGWKMVDATGHQLLPGYRPIYFLVRVAPDPA